MSVVDIEPPCLQNYKNEYFFVTKLAFKTFGCLTHLIKVKGDKGGGKGSKVVLMGAILLQIFGKEEFKGVFSIYALL